MVKILVGLFAVYLIFGASSSLLSGETLPFLGPKYATNSSLIVYQEQPKRFAFEVLMRLGVGLWLIKKVLSKNDE